LHLPACFGRIELRIVLISNLTTDTDMYVCNCMGITEREIRGAADLGCDSVKELSRELGVGTCCGKCVPEARALLARCCGGNACRMAVGGND
jgi:bacterioferritin-associated ferredoxin